MIQTSFSIPQRLHYDYVDEKTGKLKGGMIVREKLDFVLKVPYSEAMEKIDFFWYMRKISILAAAGFVAGGICFVLMRDFILHT